MPRTTYIDLKGNVIQADGFQGSVDNPAVTAIVALTDNGGGAAADGTIGAIPAATAASTDTSAASLTSTNASITALNAAVKELSTKLNALIAALKA